MSEIEVNDYQLKVTSQKPFRCVPTSLPTAKFKVTLITQFLSVGMVFAFGPCVALHLFFDSVRNNIFIMLGGLTGNFLCIVLLRSRSLRYVVLTSNAMLLIGWMWTFWSIQSILAFNASYFIYFCFFLTGIPVGILFAAILPYIPSQYENTEDMGDLYFWPQLGIILGVCITNLTLVSGIWQFPLIASAFTAFISMLSSRIFPKTLPNKPQKLSLDRCEESSLMASTIHSLDQTNSELNCKPLCDLSNPNVLDTLGMVSMQHFTGLALLPMTEIIGMNVAKDPEQCLCVFAISCLVSLIATRYNSVNPSIGLILSSGLMTIVYLLLSHMYRSTQEFGAFYSQMPVTFIMALSGLLAAIGKFHLPMLGKLLDSSSEPDQGTIFVMLTVWWISGLLFSLIFASLLFSAHLCILFNGMSLFCFSIAVICSVNLRSRVHY